MNKINMEMIERFISAAINTKYKEVPPTETQFMSEADTIRNMTQSTIQLTDEEYESILKKLKASTVIIMDDGVYIFDPDSKHQSWLPARRADIEFFYWDRYKKYLEDEKRWNTRVTATLDKVSDEIIDLLGDPKDTTNSFQRRGLVLGDVQSGKTANFTAICNKAADCGYRVIIVLAGIMENLRIQTQERLDTEFAGRRSKYLLDPKADQAIKNTPFGVGRINPNKRISCFTSVNTDFNSVILKSNDLTLANISEPAIFVVKKNKRILNNLHSWLVANNADTKNKINLPLLLIDDEADNASVNTRNEDENPTAINSAIRNILNSFYQASYLGITATPFANIFINPETKDDMLGDELFPRDFIYSLSPPSNYIGADAIFGIEAPYTSSILDIKNEEMNKFFPFKHKKDIDVYALPPSMIEAMGYFMIVNAIRDLRGDNSEHRSMLINVSRYTDVQTKISELANEWLIKVRSELRNYAALNESESSQIHSIKLLKAIWDKHKLEEVAGCSWIDLQQKYLYKAVMPIDVRAVNQRTGSASLDYYAHKSDGFRVIAVGGNSLSRGLTLEGLCVSYFYRNSQMYDTLLQMGRWFGYRENYDDLFKIWMAEDAVDWYGYITDATNELKLEIARMRAVKQTPSEFGLKVRQDPNSLIVTARNKMRTGTQVSRPITVSGRLLETPRLKNDKDVLKANEQVFKLFVANLDSIGSYAGHCHNAKLWRGIPKNLVANLLRNFDTHPWHLAFQGRALADYIESDNELLEWDVAIPQGSCKEPYVFAGAYNDIEVYPSIRTVVEDKKMILINGTKVKVGSGGSTKIGLSEKEIEKAKADFAALHPENPQKSPSDSAYLIKGRNPILMLHVIKSKSEDGKELSPNIPEHLFALGVGFPATEKGTKVANYVVNMVDLKNWIDMDEDEDDEDAI
ncbi:Z1 domain-containing protein [Clostridium amylolyticum]|uniref:Z1 domain-containing protein n=1 Tax=Clostridium amylolyticum TaxID=1121298 RepID=A0A1M6LS31_9CLOT|nr:Z1 domain-containing protein [Clostridium amylolyticum]SHJ73922.1 Z1 domain-containing protein [Clostridium amylolyticum]